MLEEQQPFKATLRVLIFLGLWKPILQKRFKRRLTILSFVLFQPLPLILVNANIWQETNVDSFVKALSFTCTFVLTASYIITFWLFNGKLQDLLNEFDEMIANNPESQPFIEKSCQKAKRIEVRKISIVIIWIVLGAIKTLRFKVLTNQIWSPEFIKHLPGFFYITWIYHTLFIAYSGVAFILALDFFFNILMAINGYICYFKNLLITLDLTGADAKKNLIHCVDVHLNIRR